MCQDSGTSHDKVIFFGLSTIKLTTAAIAHLKKKMGRVKKSTRKFENKHLKRTLDDRKAHKKTKQQFILREKKKKQRLAAKGGHEESDTEKNGAKKTKESMKLNKDDGGPKLFEDMSVDQFFSGGFEVPEPVGGNLKGGKRKRERGDGDSGKEKVFDKKDAADGSDEEEEEEEDDENEFARHKGDIGDLADKDPEFYKYLQENDPELLDFSMAEKDDLSSIDELSEEDGGDAERTGKKHKKGGKEESGRVEVTLADVKKWKAALVDQKSLRCLRQVVLAFRAAAHVNDVEVNSNQGEYKYSVTNPDGMGLPYYHARGLLKAIRNEICSNLQ
jgi:nucleolar complex protein 2